MSGRRCHAPTAATRSRAYGQAIAPALLELESRITPAFSIVADLNPNVFSIAGQSAESCVVGNVLYFTRADIANGEELWRTDGTASGTVLVKDINPGTAGSNPRGLVAIGGTVFFAADNGVSGTELWKTDGSAAGTLLVRDINPGPAGSDPTGLANLGGTLVFAGDDGARGCELWKSNGTASGTVLVKDIRPGSASGFSGLGGTSLTVAGDKAYFAANDGVAGQELWRTDGTATGTALVRDLFAGSVNGAPNGSYPGTLTALGGTLLFTADNGATGTELWKTDGTGAGTVLVRDILPGNDGGAPKSSFPLDLISMGTWATFTADNGANGRELWKTDGTTAGTALLKEIRPGAYGGFSNYAPGQFAVAGGTVFFAADNGANGMELWKTNGTTAGTVLVRDIQPGTYSVGQGKSSSPEELTAAGGRLFFTADDGVSGVELWISDGTAAGTVLARDMAPGAASSEIALLGTLGGALVFTAGDGDLWRSIGTSAGTTLLSDNQGTRGQGSNPKVPVEVGGNLYFTAFDGNYLPTLWKTGGPGTTPTALSAGFRYPGPANLVNAGGTLFFAANNGDSGVELWRSDGTSAGTQLVRDISTGSPGSAPSAIVNEGGTLYFVADDGASGRELWKSNGTTAGTVLVRDIAAGLDASGKTSSASPAELAWGGGWLWFTADDGVSGRELWKSDGTAAGTTRVADIAPGGLGSAPAELAWGGGWLWFTADDGVGGRELWKSDGTAAGTTLVKDIFQGPAGSAPDALAWGGGLLWFTADDGGGGRELWKSDGMAAGTTLVKDIFPGPSGSAPEGLAWGGGWLWFTVDDGVSGRELWKSDGTAAGSTLVKDIRLGAAGSAESGKSMLAWADGLLCLVANDGVSGSELWKSDGTAPGTVLAGEIVPGSLGGDIAWLAAFGNRAVFSADDGLRGRELWSFSPNGAPLDIRLSATAVMENQPSGTVVGNLLATDPDAGDAFTFALVAGAGDTGNSLFSISNGVLKSAAAFDFETKAARSIRVRVTDSGGLSFEKAFIISVIDVDEGPIVSAAQAVATIANLPTAVAGVSVVDPLAGAVTLTTTLSVPTGLLTLGVRTGLVFQAGDGVSDALIKFRGTLAQTNAALKSLSYITATDTLAATTIGITVQRGAFTSNAAVPLTVAEGRVVKISDPTLAGKVSVVIQGTASGDTVSVAAAGTSTSNYTVSLNGTPTVVTGITGRFVVFGLGGDDTISMMGSAVAVRADGGEGSDVIMGGMAADALFGGNGADLIAGGLGADLINGGAGNDIVIDGTVSVRAAGKTLRSVLDGWAAKAAPVDADYAAITADLAFTADKASKDTLTGGLGTDWFWSATAGAVADVLDLAAGERRRLV